MVCTPSIVVTAHDVLAGRRSGRCCLTGRRSPRSCSGSVEGISAPWSFGWVGECPRYAMVLASRVRARSAFRSACLLPLVPVSHSHISHELSITSPFGILGVSLTGHNTHRYSTLCRRTNCLGRTKEVGGRAADCSQPCLGERGSGRMQALQTIVSRILFASPLMLGAQSVGWLAVKLCCGCNSLSEFRTGPAILHCKRATKFTLVHVCVSSFCS
jgi:hypothetical protein